MTKTCQIRSRPGINFLCLSAISIFIVFLLLVVDIRFQIVAGNALAACYLLNFFVVYYYNGEAAKLMLRCNRQLQNISFKHGVNSFNRKKINFVSFCFRDGATVFSCFDWFGLSLYYALQVNEHVSVCLEI